MATNRHPTTKPNFSLWGDLLFYTNCDTVWWRRRSPSYYHGNDKMDFLDKTDFATLLALIAIERHGNGRESCTIPNNHTLPFCFVIEFSWMFFCCEMKLILLTNDYLPFRESPFGKPPIWNISI